MSTHTLSKVPLSTKVVLTDLAFDFPRCLESSSFVHPPLASSPSTSTENHFYGFEDHWSSPSASYASSSYSSGGSSPIMERYLESTSGFRQVAFPPVSRQESYRSHGTPSSYSPQTPISPINLNSFQKSESSQLWPTSPGPIDRISSGLGLQLSPSQSLDGFEGMEVSRSPTFSRPSLRDIFNSPSLVNGRAAEFKADGEGLQDSKSSQSFRSAFSSQEELRRDHFQKSASMGRASSTYLTDRVSSSNSFHLPFSGFSQISLEQERQDQVSCLQLSTSRIQTSPTLEEASHLHRQRSFTLPYSVPEYQPSSVVPSNGIWNDSGNSSSPTLNSSIYQGAGGSEDAAGRHSSRSQQPESSNHTFNSQQVFSVP